MDLAQAVVRLDEAVGEFIRSKSKDNTAVLNAIFRLNNEIGSVLRPTGDAAMRDLQLKVSELTKAAKQRDEKMVASAMERVRAVLATLQSKE